jgi:hypothetical protein
VPKSADIELLDRIVYNGKNYKVNAIDDIGLGGVARIQTGADTRPAAIDNGEEEE